MDSGAEEKAISHVDWRPLGEPSLRPAQVRLRSATGDNMGVIGSISVRGWCDEKMAELSALAATRTTKSLVSASFFLSLGCEIEMKPTHSALHHTNGDSVLFRNSGNRDVLVLRVAKKTSEMNTVTISAMQCEVESLKIKLRALRMGHLSTSEVRLP